MKTHTFFALIVLAIAGCSDSFLANQSSRATVAASASSTVKRVCAIAAEQMGVNESKIDADTSLADLGADELDLVELVMTLEEEFNQPISDAEIERMSGGADLSTSFGKLTMAKLAELVGD